MLNLEKGSGSNLVYFTEDWIGISWNVLEFFREWTSKAGETKLM